MEYHLLEIIPSLEIITLSKILITFEIHFQNFTSNKEHTISTEFSKKKHFWHVISGQRIISTPYYAEKTNFEWFCTSERLHMVHTIYCIHIVKITGVWHKISRYRCILATLSAKETIDEQKSCDLNSVNEIRKLETSYWLVW